MSYKRSGVTLCCWGEMARNLTGDQRAFILRFAEENPHVPQTEIARMTGVRRESVNRLLIRTHQRHIARGGEYKPRRARNVRVLSLTGICV